MIKNFSAGALGINGRQSELLELALTYAFDGFDIDMQDLFRRSGRTDIGDATKYLTSAARAYEQKGKPLDWGGFELEIDMDADEESFNAQVAALTPLAELAHDIGLSRALIDIPAATDRLPYNEYFEAQKGRIAQLNAVLQPLEIRLGLGFNAGQLNGEPKQFEFIRKVEGFLALVNDAGENAGFVINTWDWMIGGGSLDQIAGIPADKVVYVVLSSLPEDANAAEATSADRVLPTAEGPIDHVKLIEHLASIEYSGPISPGASAARYKGQTREAIVKDAQEAVDGIYTAAGREVQPLPMDLIEDIPYETATSIT